MAGQVRIVVCGAAGRMGRRIVALAQEAADIEVVGAVEAAGNALIGRDVGEIAGVGPIGVAIGDDLAVVAGPQTVILDFTIAEASVNNVRVAADKQAPIVIGTSGLSRTERDEIAGLAARMPTIVAANTSVGINVLLTLVQEAIARLGDGFDCEILELHHNKKKDAPSGTAVALAEAAAGAAGIDPADALVLSREGVVGERRTDEIGVVALRGGDAVGEHTVMLVGKGERLELTHRMASRDCLAAGAMAAARWLAAKKPGLYSMQDVIQGT